MNILPYKGADVNASAIDSIVQRAIMGPGMNLIHAKQLSMEEHRIGISSYFYFEYAKPHAFIVATVNAGTLYLFTAAAENSRTWMTLRDKLKSSAESFRVPKYEA